MFELGLKVLRDVRGMESVKVGAATQILLARNDDYLQCTRINEKDPLAF
jgi:hypothetical protein